MNPHSSTTGRSRWWGSAQRTSERGAGLPPRFTLALIASALVTLGAVATVPIIARPLWSALAIAAAAIAFYGAFRTLAATLARHQDLERWLAENVSSAQLLVRKDRAVSQANEKLLRVTGELSDVGRILVRRDIELSEANTRLAGLDLVKSEFVSVAAHQLRTPLTGVRWSLQALVDGELGALTDEQHKALEESLEVTITAANLINDLLDTARIEEGRFGYKPEMQDFLPVVEKVVTATRPNAERKKIAFSISMPNVLPAVFIDAEKIGIVIDNLVNNAIKYTPEGGAVALTVRKRARDIEVSIADTGIGIPKEQQRHVFDQFFRARNAKLYVTTGTGLGLYMAKNIVENHGGTMDFTSAENEGTTFRFTIPLRPAKPEILNSKS
jgi:signal transduction histidine kinase